MPAYMEIVCLQCGVTKRAAKHSKGKYCSVQCQVDHQYENIIKPAVLSGAVCGVKALKRVLRDVFGDKCDECDLPAFWNGKPLSLHMDHIDGDSDNSTISNVRLLCPNCHTQTETFGSKGKGNRYKKTTKRNVYLQKYKS